MKIYPESRVELFLARTSAQFDLTFARIESMPRGDARTKALTRLCNQLTRTMRLTGRLNAMLRESIGDNLS